MSPLVKTLLFPFVILACLGGALIAWCGIVVIAVVGVIYSAFITVKELYEEEK